MIAATKKRIRDIESNMTPKEFAILLVDAMREYPSIEAYTDAQIRKPAATDTEIVRPYDLIGEQVKRRYGRNPKGDEWKAVQKQALALQTEFHALKMLIWRINEDVGSKAQTAGLEAALRAQLLQSVIVQDSFSRTARKAIEWVEEYKTADEEEEVSRQGMLDELAAYDYNPEPGSSGIDFGSFRIELPSRLEAMVDDIKALIFDLYKHRDAVAYIEAKYFDGHHILALDREAGLQRVIRIVEDIVQAHNEYLERRAAVFSAEWDEDEAEGLIGGLIGERQGRLRIDLAKLVPMKSLAKGMAESWVKRSKYEAKVQMSDSATRDWREFQQMEGIDR